MANPDGVPPLRDHQVVAQNLPEHARNPIHTDEGARAAGFDRALVAGVTTYAYLANVPSRDWGIDWVHHGAAEVRFRRPVFDRERLTVQPVNDGQSLAVTTPHDDEPRVVCSMTLTGAPAVELRDGEELPTLERVLEGEYGGDYAERAGDPLPLFATGEIVHPAVWPALANDMVHRHVARGSWVHTRSIVRHHAPVATGALVSVVARVVDRRDGSLGERAVLDVHITAGGTVVASLEHEAYVALR